MPHKTPIFLLLLLMVAVLSPAATAQAQSGQAAFFVENVDITAFPQVTIQLSAWDATGLPLANLKPEDFILQEYGVPFHPKKVQVDAQAPLQVALVIDTSGSMAGVPLVDAKAAAARFIDRLSPGDQAGLIAFSDGLDIDPGKLDPKRERALSTDREALYALVENLEAVGGTHLYNAAAKAVRLLEGQRAGHRAVLLLSDGRNDPPALGDPQEAVQLAKEARVPFFVIGLGSQVDEPYLQRLASETGGLFRSAPKSSELARLFADMASLLKTRYTLTYTSKLNGQGQTAPLIIQLNSQGTKAESQVKIGPLPVIPTATAVPQPSATTLPPVAEPTQPQPTAVLAATAAAPAQPEDLTAFPWGWPVTAVATIAFVVGAILLRRPKAVPEACAKCGFPLTGVVGACPQCGETRRLPKKK